MQLVFIARVHLDKKLLCTHMQMLACKLHTCACVQLTINFVKGINVIKPSKTANEVIILIITVWNTIS